MITTARITDTRKLALAGLSLSMLMSSLNTSITNAGLRESHAHDVVITKEAPNYRMETGD